MARNCFAPGCDTGYPSSLKRNKALGKKNPSLFSAPKDVEVLEKWQRAIPRKDKVFMRPYKLCELHFDDECISRTIEVKLTDGTLYVQERERPILKDGSVPTIFPNLPKYLSSDTPKRKAPTPRNKSNKKIKLASIENQIPESTIDIPTDSRFDESLNDLSTIEKPSKCWIITKNDDANIICIKFDSDYRCERHVVVNQDYSVKIFLRNKEIKLDKMNKAESAQKLSLLLKKVDNLVICSHLESWQLCDCLGFIECLEQSSCSNCQKNTEGQKTLYQKKIQMLTQKKIRLALHRKYVLRKNARLIKKVSHLKQEVRSAWIHCKNLKEDVLQKTLYQKKIQMLTQKKIRLALHRKYVLRKNARLIKKVSHLKQEVRSAWIHCKNLKEDVLQSAICDLPPEQQTAIRTCVAAAKLKNRKSIRYNFEWIYECLLLRIKSKKAYEHLRQRNILTLPSYKTLSKYIQEIKGQYGFHQSTFACLQTKASLMNDQDRRGVILVDEMKLAKAVNFSKKELEILGFVDLGDYTPEEQKDQLGDHALVFMFQPFRGRWVQALGCFLSKGAASGKVLHHLVIECIALLEKSNFFVDAVVSDGASWNRNMWLQFGITEENVSCPHICDENRRLWFISDFPHLIKNVRNAISSYKQMMTHTGLISTKFWEAVVDMDIPRGYNLKACDKLTYDTIYPESFQKMNVPMAFQFFSKKVASAMILYKEDNVLLENSGPCAEIIQIFDSAFRAMNSRTPTDALKLNSPEENAIRVLLEFVIEWEKFAKARNYSFLSDSTCYGLKVTLKATLEMTAFLTDVCGFKYLMTSRLNQDSLERFFSMMRGACGSNDHPDSQTFMQLYRLLSTYSLVKPPRGSCTASTEILSTLLSINDVKEEVTAKKETWKTFLDSVIDQGTTEELLPKALDMVDDHNYDMLTSSNFIISYISGYVVRRTSKFTNCDMCLQSLTTPDANDEENNKFIELNSRGYLYYPSQGIVNLITSLENSIMSTLRRTKIHRELLYDVMHDICNAQSIVLVGCNEHKHFLTEKIVQFYLITRFHFICKQFNKNESSTKTKRLRKFAKFC